MNVNEILSSMTKEQIKDYKDSSIEMQTFAGKSLDDIVIKLEQLRRQGKLNYYANWNGIKLYSLDVTMDSAFKECLNCSRKTWLKREKRWFEDDEASIKKWEKEAQEKLPTWIEEGKKYIHPEKFEIWKKTCISSANGDYYGLEVEKALEIMAMLEDKVELPKIKQKIKDDGHSGMTYSSTMNLVLFYAKRGPALYNFMNKNRMSKIDKKYVSKIKELNKKLNMGYKYSEAMEELKDHKIMDISISLDLTNYDEYTKYKEDYYKGTILINEDLTFEGVINDEKYITGKMLGNDGITFADFCNYTKASHYCGIRHNDKLIGRHEIYSVSSGVTDKGGVIIKLADSTKNFVDEIDLETEIKQLKKYFDDDVKDMCVWFSTNIDSETQRTFMILRNELNERLVNVLSNQINQDKLLEEQQIKNEKVKQLRLQRKLEKSKQNGK